MTDIKVGFYNLIHSRKFWAAVIGVIVITVKALVPTIPVSEEDIGKILWMIIAFIIGDSLSDVGAGLKAVAQTSMKK